MDHSYPEEMFLQDFQVLGALAPSEAISKHFSSGAGDNQSSQWRFNVFCKTIVVLNEFKKDDEFRDFLNSHSEYSETEVSDAIARAVHFLVARNIGENLSYQPSWDETALTARLYLEPSERFSVPHTTKIRIAREFKKFNVAE